MTALLFVGCAEDITINNGSGKYIAFRVSEAGVATVADDPVTGTTRMSEFVPSNGLFTPSVYPLSQKSAAQTSVAQPIESDFKEPLYMTVTTEPLSHKASTRGTEISSFTSGDKISVTAYLSATPTAAEFANQDAEYKTDNLFHTTKPWGSSASTNYDFYAWHPASLTGSKNSAGLSFSSEKTITYDITGLASSAMPDLLGGTALGKNYALKNDGSVDLTFSHLLTPVRFQLASGFDGTITSIKFENIVTKADHTIGTTHATYGCDWTTNTTTGDWTSQTLSTTGDTSDPTDPTKTVQVDGTEYFMMIPQTIAEGTVVTIGLTAGSNNYTLQYATPADLVWKAGELVTYTISADGLTTMTVNYPTGWTETTANDTPGPITAYATGDYAGLFAVNPATGAIESTINNLKVPVSGASCPIDLATLFPSVKFYQSFEYYLMYPWVSGTTISASNVAAASAASTPFDAAEKFFGSVISGWASAHIDIDDQDTDANFLSQDLQVAKFVSGGYIMEHKMGLVALTMGTANAPRIIHYDNKSASENYRDANVSATSRALFEDFSPLQKTISGTDVYYLIVKPETTYTLNSGFKAETHTGTLLEHQWIQTVANTDVTTGGYVAYDPKPNFKGFSLLYRYDDSPKSPITWKAPYKGDYTFACWGASGGQASHGDNCTGCFGRGAYVDGDITLDENDTFYFYIGGKGGTTSKNSAGWNGGGPKGTESGDGAGGGATDIRLTNGAWDNAASLLSRVMVAGGGGGDDDHDGNNTSNAYGTRWGSNDANATKARMALSCGGGLYLGNNSHTNTATNTGATQTSPGKVVFSSSRSDSPNEGGFGYACQTFNASSPGGGGGYWGGANSDDCGMGGTSYISGHNGCVAITDPTTNPVSTVGGTGEALSIHSSGTYFTGTRMYDGAGYRWTTTRAGSQTTVPHPTGGTYPAGEGNTGDGYVEVYIWDIKL